MTDKENEIPKGVFDSLANKLQVIREKCNLDFYKIFYPYPNWCSGTKEDAEGVLLTVLEGEEEQIPFTELEIKILMKVMNGEYGSIPSIMKIWQGIKELEEDLVFILESDSDDLEAYYG